VAAAQAQASMSPLVTQFLMSLKPVTSPMTLPTVLTPSQTWPQSTASEADHRLNSVTGFQRAGGNSDASRLHASLKPPGPGSYRRDSRGPTLDRPRTHALAAPCTVKWRGARSRTRSYAIDRMERPSSSPKPSFGLLPSRRSVSPGRIRTRRTPTGRGLR
jgi:hypothetical protein